MPHKRKVLFAVPAMGPGGAERQVIGNLRHLDRSAFAPLAYVTYRQGEQLVDVPDDVPVFAFAEEPVERGWDVPGRMYLRRAAHLAKVIKEQRVDLVYACATHMIQDVFGSTLFHSVPWMAVEVVDPTTGIDDYTARFRWAKRWLTHRAMHAADRAIAVSEGVRNGIAERYGIPDERVATILYFVDTERIDRLAAEPLELPGERFNIVCAGRLHRQKGYLYLLEAVKELVRAERFRHVLVHILGRGPHERELKDRIRQDALEPNVKIHGHVGNPYAYLRRADLFCLPSLYEGLPNALMEAMACGVPIVAADCRSGPRELLKGGQLGRLVPTEDSASLADAIRDRIENHESWRDRTHAAREFVERELSPLKQVKALEDLIRLVLDEQSGRR